MGPDDNDAFALLDAAGKRKADGGVEDLDVEMKDMSLADAPFSYEQKETVDIQNAHRIVTSELGFVRVRLFCRRAHGARS